MPNESKKIIDRLFGGENSELMSHDLERMLDEELKKPEEEMDTQLVSELLDQLVPDMPSKSDKEADWLAIQKKRSNRSKFHRLPALRKIAVLAASFVFISIICFTSAQAFNWTFLWKYLVPVAETFGIISTNRLTDDGQRIAEFRAEDAPGAQEITFYSEEDIPSDLGKAVIESGCVLPFYDFTQGVWFKSPIMEKCNLFYSHDDDWISIEAIIFDIDDNTSLDYEFEKRSEIPDVFMVENVEVTLYNNYDSDSIGMSASWLIGNSNYYLNGTISKEELIDIVSKLQSV